MEETTGIIPTYQNYHYWSNHFSALDFPVLIHSCILPMASVSLPHLQCLHIYSIQQRYYHFCQQLTPLHKVILANILRILKLNFNQKIQGFHIFLQLQPIQTLHRRKFPLKRPMTDKIQPLRG